MRWCSAINLSIVILISVLTVITKCEELFNSTRSTYIDDENFQCLRELPINELLRIKKSIQVLSNNSDGSHTDNKNNTNTIEILNESNDNAFNRHDTILMDLDHQHNLTALPLIDNKIRKSGWEEEKPNKLQTIFQVSVTSLAFLAFGGYLLCMIVQAIKSKGTTYYHTAAMTATQNTPIKRKTRRPQILNRYRRQISNDDVRINSTALPFILNDTMAGPSPDIMFKYLEEVAECYVQFH